MTARNPARRPARLGPALLALVALAAPLTGISAAPATAQDTPPAIPSTSGRAPYPGDPESEAALVASEDSRLVETRTVDSLARWSKLTLDTPYRLATGSAYTLVLTPRTDAYTIQDLLGLAPQTFVHQPNGAYLLSEHLVIQSGATLNLASAGGLRLRLASDRAGFVSIVNYGGRLNITGTAGKPVVVTSWDRSRQAPDRLTNDGRAYIRSLGGQVQISHARFSDLGFWSGRTGGLSLTGTDRPNSGALDKLGQTLRVGKRAQRERDAEAAANPPEPQVGLDGRGKATLSEVLPAGDLPVPFVDVANPAYSYVSASLKHTTVEGNAYGLFVSSADGLDIRNSSFSRNLVDGIVMHRYVTNAVVQSTAADDNGGDGFVLARATTGIVLSEVEADRNTRNGVSLSGLPLANGPSATGTSVGSYGNNSVSNSRVSGNGRYGIEVVGGRNVGVQANDLSGNDMAIVVREGARGVTVVGNRVTAPVRQGISLRDGVRRAVVSGNIVSGGLTSVYVRDTEASVSRNTLADATSHAVSLVGVVRGTTLTENTISGRGPSAIDSKRAVDLEPDGWRNDLGGWRDTTPLLVSLKRLAQPLTLLWVGLAGLLVFTALRGSRDRGRSHPYAEKAPVTDGIPAVRSWNGVRS